MQTRLLGVVMLLYFLAGLLFLIATLFGSSRLNKTARTGLVLGWSIHTVSLIWRWVESYQLGIGHAPMSNFYESLLFFFLVLVCIVFLGFWRQTQGYWDFCWACWPASSWAMPPSAGIPPI